MGQVKTGEGGGRDGLVRSGEGKRQKTVLEQQQKKRREKKKNKLKCVFHIFCCEGVLKVINFLLINAFAVSQI